MSNVAEADKMVELLRELDELNKKIRTQAEWMVRNSILPVVTDACRDAEYMTYSIQDLFELGQLKDIIRIIEENKESFEENKES